MDDSLCHRHSDLARLDLGEVVTSNCHVERAAGLADEAVRRCQQVLVVEDGRHAEVGAAELDRDGPRCLAEVGLLTALDPTLATRQLPHTALDVRH